MTNELYATLSVVCDKYDLNSRKPVDALHITVEVSDSEEGTRRRLDVRMEPNGKCADDLGGWTPLVDRIVSMVDGLSDTTDDDLSDTSRWHGESYGKRSSRIDIRLDGFNSGITVILRGYASDLRSEEPHCMLYATGRGSLSLPADETAALLGVQPSEWFLPDYRSEDWIAHEGRFSEASFSESDIEWTRKKILRGLEVARREKQHYERMAKIFEERTGQAIDG